MTVIVTATGHPAPAHEIAETSHINNSVSVRIPNRVLERKKISNSFPQVSFPVMVTGAYAVFFA